jgi:cytochrome c5
MKNKIIIATCIVLASCASKLYIPTAKTATVSLENLNKGRDLYSNSCSSCHELFLPNKYTAAEWHKNLDWMQERAKITDAEKQLIYDYLVSAPK